MINKKQKYNFDNILLEISEYCLDIKTIKNLESIINEHLQCFYLIEQDYACEIIEKTITNDMKYDNSIFIIKIWCSKRYVLETYYTK